MKSKYKILITGAAGFLGSHQVEKLHNLGHTVIGIDNMMGGYEDNVPKNIKFHKCPKNTLWTTSETLTQRRMFLIGGFSKDTFF